VILWLLFFMEIVSYFEAEIAMFFGVEKEYWRRVRGIVRNVALRAL